MTSQGRKQARSGASRSAVDRDRPPKIVRGARDVALTQRPAGSPDERTSQMAAAKPFVHRMLELEQLPRGDDIVGETSCSGQLIGVDAVDHEWLVDVEEGPSRSGRAKLEH